MGSFPAILCRFVGISRGVFAPESYNPTKWTISEPLEATEMVARKDVAVIDNLTNGSTMSDLASDEDVLTEISIRYMLDSEGFGTPADRGLMENFSGFIYRSDNKEPSQNEFGGDFKEVVKLKEHWFWAVSG